MGNINTSAGRAVANIVLCESNEWLPAGLPDRLARLEHRVKITECPPGMDMSADLYVTDMACARRLLTNTTAPAVLVVTDRLDSRVLREAVDIGATGLASTANNDVEIATAIDRVATGQPYFDANLLRAALPGQSHLSQEQARRIAAELTAREWQVLEYLTRGASTRDIATALAVATPTVRSHVHQILTKLGVHSRLEAATFMLKHRVEPPGRKQR